ncbi:hypothetical protein GCM10009804_63630 [Kribbella hippodromi]|uniref:Uncharacterized protein n=1 Tax=Kribbella hippodromi TaxID=434347 RepID=A0ABN2EAW9_9ACTN
MTVNGEITNPPEIDAGLAAAALAVFAHRHEVVHLLYAATDEPDALARIGGLLRVDEATIARVLDQPLRWMLPQFRSELETIAAMPAPPTAGTAPATAPATERATAPATTSSTAQPASPGTALDETATPTSTPAPAAMPAQPAGAADAADNLESATARTS